MNKQNVLIAIGGIFLVLFVAVFIFSRPASNSFTPGTIVVWGTAPKESFQEAILSYQKLNEGSKVTYVEKPAKDFEIVLVNALAAGKGPDAWIADQELITTHADKIRSFPAAFFSASTLRTSMVDLAYDLYVVQNDDLPTSVVRAVPLWVDPLVLFWNRDLFNGASIATPPSNWTDFQQTSTRLVRRDAQANIGVSGAAFGRGENVPEAYDIVMLMLMQRGGNLMSDKGRIDFGNPNVEPNERTSLTESVLRYYTDFGNIGRSTYSWSASFSSPLDRFAGGRAGMMVNYLSSIAIIEETNPHLGVNVSPVPQATEKALTLARVPAFAVSAQSKNPTQAWHFGSYLATDAASTFAIPQGTAPALRSLLESKSDQTYKAIVTAASLQASWPRDPFPATSRSILNSTIDAVANTKLTVTEGASSARTQLERALNKIN